MLLIHSCPCIGFTEEGNTYVSSYDQRIHIFHLQMGFVFLAVGGVINAAAVSFAVFVLKVTHHYQTDQRFVA